MGWFGTTQNQREPGSQHVTNAQVRFGSAGSEPKLIITSLGEPERLGSRIPHYRCGTSRDTRLMILIMRVMHTCTTPSPTIAETLRLIELVSRRHPGDSGRHPPQTIMKIKITKER